MVADLVLKAVFSVFDLLRGAFFLSIIAFAAVFVASFFHAWLSKRFKFSWLKATMITSYLAIFLLIMVLYSAPFFSALKESDQGQATEFFQVTAFDWAYFLLSIIVRNAAIALLFAFFILPLEFLSSMVLDFLKEKTKWNKWITVFIAVFASCLAASIVSIFLLPWLVPGLVYLTFYWHL